MIDSAEAFRQVGRCLPVPRQGKIRQIPAQWIRERRKIGIPPEARASERSGSRPANRQTHRSSESAPPAFVRPEAARAKRRCSFPRSAEAAGVPAANACQLPGDGGQGFAVRECPGTTDLPSKAGNAARGSKVRWFPLQPCRHRYARSPRPYRSTRMSRNPLRGHPAAQGDHGHARSGGRARAGIVKPLNLPRVVPAAERPHLK